MLHADEYFGVERVVEEFNVIKQVLINNAIPVDFAELDRSGQSKTGEKNSRGWGMRVLFDKKVFMSLLTELEQMRKIYSIKKQFYLFNLPYEGKPKKLSAWHQKVE